ncbi:MAG TPA: hypothetical protein VFG69_03795, partial [Nannocystaceae bacterium]|nr:hypothetical protein [Nannocystaceae bacterium]
MAIRGLVAALVLAFVLPACAQGGNSGGATFGMSFTGAPADDDDDGSATGDDDGDGTAGTGGDGSG